MAVVSAELLKSASRVLPAPDVGSDDHFVCFVYGLNWAVCVGMQPEVVDVVVTVRG